MSISRAVYILIFGVFCILFGIAIMLYNPPLWMDILWGFGMAMFAITASLEKR